MLTLKPLAITKADARMFMLRYQNLYPPRSLPGKKGMMEHFHRVRAVQFDPINVTGRTHEIALAARVLGFRQDMLEQALYVDRSLVDEFDKCMCILPVEDWPYFRRTRIQWRRRIEDRYPKALWARDRVREEILARGPLSSRDIDLSDPVRWPWGETRMARAVLEGMYFQGELVIHHKVGARKVYDLAERHLPGRIFSAPEPNPREEDYHDWHVERRVGSVGLLARRGTQSWLGIADSTGPKRAESLGRLLKAGLLREVRVEGISGPMYMRAGDEHLLESASWEPKSAALIAPLDNLIWDRRLCRELFGFEYSWEVYVPAQKRRYGYYVLPVLYGDRFVARVEPRRDTKNGVLSIKNWWWEDGVDTDDGDMLQAISQCVDAFRDYLGCHSVIWDSGPGHLCE